MNTLFLIAWKEFSDRFRSGWVLVCVLVWLGAIILTSIFGLVQVGRIGVQGYDRTVVSLLNLVQYLVPLLGLLLGHDLLVSEREERTLALILASGVSRARVLVGKFLGGAVALAAPLTVGFIVAGTIVGVAARDRAVTPFVVLAVSGLVLGIIFVAVGMCISAICRTRVQALVLALLGWCAAVFAFDLIALGLLVSARTPMAQQEIDAYCDPTHVAAVADLHASYEAPAGAELDRARKKREAALRWLLLNPIDLFRAINVSQQTNTRLPGSLAVFSGGSWILASLALSWWRFRRMDV
jgi:Cu-processing system permease protein